SGSSRAASSTATAVRVECIRLSITEIRPFYQISETTPTRAASQTSAIPASSVPSTRGQIWEPWRGREL
ncbi:hypothetical protein KI387_013297, partial [Taxus chinensis]